MDDHIKPEISTYLAGALTESRNRQIEAHVASCEKCRTALARARNKQARVKREALKKASTEKMPNLFLARQGKESAASVFFHSGTFRKGALLLLAIGLMYWGFHRGPASAPVAPEEAPAQASEEAVKPETPEHPVVMPAAPSPTRAEKPSSPAATAPLVIPRAPEVPKAPLILPVIQSWKGAESAVHGNRVIVVRTLEGFQKLWAEMKVPDTIPVVDFSDKIVLAMFAGPLAPGSSIEVGKIEEVVDAMVAPYRVNASASPMAISTVSAPVEQAYPYLLVVVPRVDRKIKISRRDAL